MAKAGSAAKMLDGETDAVDDASILRDWHFENLRLRELCARSDEVASRHAIMLREADHRIKNSLRIVAGLIQVQARREESVSAREALRVAASRMQSIARIHDALQISQGQDMVELSERLSRQSSRHDPYQSYAGQRSHAAAGARELGLQEVADGARGAGEKLQWVD